MFQVKEHVFVYNRRCISSRTGKLPHQLFIRETTSLPIWQIFVSSDIFASILEHQEMERKTFVFFAQKGA
jgi:hypothetical protein